VPLLFVDCSAPLEVLLDRVATRQHRGGEVSDAGPAVVERQLAELEPLAEVPAASMIALDTTRAVADLVEEVELRFFGSLPRRGWASGRGAPAR
jgi:predicted kinase